MSYPGILPITKGWKKFYKESEESYRTLAEWAQDAIFVNDECGLVRYVNQYGASLLMLTQKEMLGKTLTELFASETVEQQMFCLNKVFQSGKPFDSEIKLLLPKGEMWLHSRFIPLTSIACEGKLVLGIARDITARKKADERRKRAEIELTILKQIYISI